MMTERRSAQQLYGCILEKWPLLNDTAESDSGWLNVGYWIPSASSYAAACRNLAWRLAEALQIKPGDSVLEVGCGTGEAAMFWVEEFLRAQGGAPSIVGRDLTAKHIDGPGAGCVNGTIRPVRSIGGRRRRGAHGS